MKNVAGLNIVTLPTAVIDSSTVLVLHCYKFYKFRKSVGDVDKVANLAEM